MAPTLSKALLSRSQVGSDPDRLATACTIFRVLRVEWILSLPNEYGVDLLLSFVEEILRRVEPDSEVVKATGISDEYSDILENEAEFTEKFHYHKFGKDTRMDSMVAAILRIRDYRDYRGLKEGIRLPRTLPRCLEYKEATSSSLTKCILYERRKTWELAQSHPLFGYFESPSEIKKILIQFFDLRFTSLFADITGINIALDPKGKFGSSVWLRLPNEKPEFTNNTMSVKRLEALNEKIYAQLKTEGEKYENERMMATEEDTDESNDDDSGEDEGVKVDEGGDVGENDVVMKEEDIKEAEDIGESEVVVKVEDIEEDEDMGESEVVVKVEDIEEYEDLYSA